MLYRIYNLHYMTHNSDEGYFNIYILFHILKKYNIHCYAIDNDHINDYVFRIIDYFNVIIVPNVNIVTIYSIIYKFDSTIIHSNVYSVPKRNKYT